MRAYYQDDHLGTGGSGAQSEIFHSIMARNLVSCVATTSGFPDIPGFSKFLGESLRPVRSLDKFGPSLDPFIGRKNALAQCNFLASVV